MYGLMRRTLATSAGAMSPFGETVSGLRGRRGRGRGLRLRRRSLKMTIQTREATAQAAAGGGPSSRKNRRASRRKGLGEDRRERRRRNEELFRQVNERILEVAEPFAEMAGTHELEAVCECGDIQCTERIRLAIDDYRAVRSSPDCFVVVPGHERLENEELIERRPGRYLVVRKKV